MTLAINILLWLVVAGLALTAATRGQVLLKEGARGGAMEFLLLLPRIGIGVIGSGFLAEALPNEWIAPWLGPQSGFFGVMIATIGGALTPGGPVVGFSIGAAATEKRSGRAASHRLFDRMGFVRDPSVADLGSSADAGARGMAARDGVAAAAVSRSRAGDPARTALKQRFLRYSHRCRPC